MVFLQIANKMKKKNKIIISFDWSHSFVSSTVDITTLSVITFANSNIAWFYHTTCKAIKNHRIDYGFFRFPDYKMSNWRVWPVSKGCSLHGTWSYLFSVEIYVCSASILYFSFGLLILNTVHYHQMFLIRNILDIRHLKIVKRCSSFYIKRILKICDYLFWIKRELKNMHIYLVRGRKQVYCPWRQQIFNETKPKERVAFKEDK